MPEEDRSSWQRIVELAKAMPEAADLNAIKEKYDRRRFELAVRHYQEELDLMKAENDEAWAAVSRGARVVEPGEG